MRSLLDLMKSENAPKCGKPDGEGGQLSRPFLEPGFLLQERWGLHDRQQPCRAVHQAVGERAEELAFLWERQDGAWQRGLPLCRVHLQATGVFNPGKPQEFL